VPSFASAHKRRISLFALLLFALLLALPLPAGAADTMADSVFISIRYYEGLDPANIPEMERFTREGFIPIIRETDGFIAYYIVYPTDGTGASISIFETREQATASNELARDYIQANLAPLLPNPPRIVEGTVDIGFVEMLDGMGNGDVSSLHASVRIYDGFEADDLDEFVTIVEDGFLPIMRDSDGFFGYYLMHDGAGAVSAISIFDSEASALASNEQAREFVAENLTAYLPNDPLITAGRVGIAVLADLNDGANLIDDMMMDTAFASVRIYDGVDPADQHEITRLTAEGFLPIMRESDGFIAYFLLPQGDTLVAYSAFETAEQAAASNDAARDFVAEKLAPLLPNAPTIVQGTMDTRHFARLDDMMSEDVTSLYASLRLYVEVDLTQRAHSTELVNRIFLPQQRETEGFWGYFRMHDGESRSVAMSIYDSEENALAANELAAAFVAEYLTDRPDQVPLRVSGRLGIAARADINEGANLIEDTMKTEAVFASVRVYDGVDPAASETYIRLANDGFLPIIRESEGFIGFYLLLAGDRQASVSLFESEEQAQASQETARDFIAEHLAPLMPNPPQIVEGLVEVMYIADANEMMMGNGTSSLHALLAIYDGFDMARLDEAVDSVESILIPDLREHGGLFAYYGISDGADTAVALRIMDSEQSLQQGSEIAAEFIAEYAADWLPEDPLQVTGPLAVAALADLRMGENLVNGMTGDSVFTSVRVYDGIDPADQAEIVRLTDEGFLPIIRESDGFVGYYFLPAADRLATISLFDSPEQASASNESARDFIVENLAPLLPNAPMIFEGPLSMNYVAALHGSAAFAGVDVLYSSIRFYEGFDLRHFDEANDLAISHLLPALQGLGGLFAQYAFNDGEDTVVGISIFESEEAALAANDVGKAFTIEYLADWAPNPPTGISGEIAIAAQAAINMGENLVGATMEE